MVFVLGLHTDAHLARNTWLDAEAFGIGKLLADCNA